MTKRKKQKATPKRKTKRIQKPKQSKKASPFKWIGLLAIVLISLSIVVGLQLKQSQKSSSATEVSSNLDDALMQKMRKMLAKEQEELKSTHLSTPSTPKPPVLPPEPSVKTSQIKEHPKPSEAIDYEKNLEKEPEVKETKIKEPAVYSGKPRLAIIIDDVSFEHQVEKIKSIPFAITPSILPPTKRHPDSDKLAQSFEFYMVHLPMEAVSHNSPESRTLKVGESSKSIMQWIDTLHKQFPKALYYNNHTGSKFTASKESMDILIRALKAKNLLFLDSKTTPKSVAVEVGKEYGMHIHVRDVFLDNLSDKEAIKTQLKKAVSIAKAKGKAIAIGHPHPNTLSVLKNASEILKDVEVVYVKDL